MVPDKHIILVEVIFKFIRGTTTPLGKLCYEKWLGYKSGSDNFRWKSPIDQKNTFNLVVKCFCSCKVLILDKNK